MKKAFAMIISLCLLLMTAPSIQGAESEAEFEGYLVKVNSQAPSFLTTFDADGDSQTDTRYFVVDSPEEAAEFAALSDIEYIEPNYILTLFEGEEASYTPSQWELSAVNAQAAWDSGLTGAGVKVAVIDSGLRITHEDFKSENILPVVDFTGDGSSIMDATGHGTVVGGMIAAQVNNEQTAGTPAVDGIAPGVTILPLRVFSKTKTATVSMAVEAIEYAVEQDCDVINMSFGIRNNSSQALKDVCQEASDAGILLVAAAGNWYGTDYSYPASYDCVVSVASVQQGSTEGEYTRAPFSQQNDQVFVAAPGMEITGLSYAGDQEYVTGKEGTSFSAPMVSGMAALAKEQNASITTETFQKLLIASSIDLGTAGKDNQYGYGLIDMEAYIEELTREYDIIFVNDESLPDWPENTTYDLSQTEELVLPTPVRENYTFLGWFDNCERTGEAIKAIAPGTVGDFTLYAGWESNDEAEVQSVTVAGFEAERSIEAENTFTITLAKNVSVEAETIQITPLTEGAQVSDLTNQGTEWSFTVTSQSGKVQKKFTLIITQVDNTAPERLCEQVQGTAVPASLDGLTQAVPYSVQTAQYFQDAESDVLFYELLETEGIHAEWNREIGELSYTPQTQDAGKTVEFQVYATDGMFESERLTILVSVGELPASLPVLETTQATFDLYHPEDIEIRLNLYDDMIAGVFLKENEPEAQEIALTAGEDYILLSSMTDGYDAVKILSERLQQEAAGNYQIIVSFQSEEIREAALTISDTAPRYTIRFTADGSSVYATRENIRVGSTVTLPEDPSKTGYTFEGWYTGPNGTGTQFTAQTPVTSSQTIYAKWESSDPTGGGGGGTSGGGGGGGGISISTYTITASAGSGGSIELDSERVLAGGDAVVTVTPDEGFVISEIIMDGVRIELPENPAAVWEYTWTEVSESHTIHVNFVEKDETIEELVSFSDVSKEDWFYEAVEFVSKQGLFSGNGEGMFLPEGNMTRAMLVSVLYRLAGEPEVSAVDSPFIDVSEESWYAQAVTWASESGVISGYGDGRFGPDDSITREGIAAILWRYAGSPQTEHKELSYEDASQISAYASDAMGWAVESGLLVGSDNHLNPVGTAMRSEVAAILMRFVQNYS